MSGAARLQVQELLTTRTEHEAAFLVWCLQRTALNKSCSFTQTANGDDQLRHRVRQKIATFFRR
jgi:hypothetical protein